MAQPAISAPRLAVTDMDEPEPMPVSVPVSEPASAVPSGVEALTGLLASLKEAEDLKRRCEGFRYYAVVVKEGKDPQVFTYDSVPALIAGTRPKRGEKRNIFIFHGESWGISRGEFKYLVSPGGERFPLFDPDAKADIDPFGRLDDVDGEEAEGEDEIDGGGVASDIPSPV